MDARASVGVDVGGGEDEVRARVPVRSHAQALPCGSPAHTTGLSILA